MRNRIATIRTLLAGSLVGQLAAPEYTDVLGELNEVLRVGGVKEAKRRRLLEVFHLSRSVDTSLRAFLDAHGWPVALLHGIGDYLLELQRQAHHHPGIGRLPAPSRQRYQQSIADVRNRYLHTANSYPPADIHSQTLVAEIQACIAEVVSL